jgi:GGDEF domain-containing protein
MDLHQVQFEHDNQYDLLTGSDTPVAFYKNLLRLISSRKRNGGALFIITVKLLAPTRIYKDGSPASKRQISEFENSLMEVSLLIKKNLRSQDCYTRMAIDGFYILISGERDEEPKVVERFKKLFADRASYEVNSHKLIGDISATIWLGQVDESFFNVK